MIDFRYHVVSLAAALIALAVGIVLGAGPLKNGISEQLNKQVVQLRADKDELRSQLDSTNAELRVHQDFEEARLTEIVAGRLTDASVVLVTLPQAGSNLVSGIDDTLRSAGASITGEVTLTAAYADPAEQATAQRTEVANEALTQLGLPEPADGTPALDLALARILTERTPDPEITDAATPPTPEARAAAWATLQDAGLVAGQLPGRIARAVVIVAGPALEDQDDNVAAAERFAKTAAGLDAGSDGVVLGAELSTAEVVSPLTTLRADSALRRSVSTVDDAATPLGRASVVYALDEQRTGGVGQYGLLAGATGPFPEGG